MEREEQQTHEGACMAGDPSGGATVNAAMDDSEARAIERQLEAEYAEVEEASAEDTNAENVSDEALDDDSEEEE